MPHPRPVHRIELSGKHLKGRMILAVVLAVIGFGALGYGLMQLLTTQSGWVTIEADTGSYASSAQEFVFQYCLGAGEMSPTAEKKALTLLYSDLSLEAYRLFQTKQAYDGVHNLEYINRHINEVIEVEEGLYRAFETCLEGGSRRLYLAPLYGQYTSLFFCHEDWEAVNFDPLKNQELREEMGELVDYLSDPDQIRLELLENFSVRLVVSEEYQNYLRESWEEIYIDFGWMKNAFLIDYLAEELTERGYTHGNLSSYDGFYRNLDDRGETYVLPLYHRVDNRITGAGTMKYVGGGSIVFLRDYPMDSMDGERFYEYGDGQIRVPYVDPVDGMPKAAVDSMVGFCREKGCGQILMELAETYVTDELTQEKLRLLEESGISFLYFQDGEPVLGGKRAFTLEP